MRKLKENWFNDLKVGDKVIINKRIGNSYYYPFSFVDDMSKKAGKTYTISHIDEDGGYCFEDYEFHNGDCRSYKLQEIGYTWHSSMFTPVDDRFYEDFLTLQINISEIKITL